MSKWVPKEIQTDVKNTRLILALDVQLCKIMSNQYRYDDDDAGARSQFSELLDLDSNSTTRCLSV